MSASSLVMTKSCELVGYQNLTNPDQRFKCFLTGASLWLGKKEKFLKPSGGVGNKS